MTSKNTKCRAAGGVNSCDDPKCPERRNAPVPYKISSSLAKEFTSRASLEEAPTGWANGATNLLTTIHGSTLYGLSHEGSDEDYYTVVPSHYIGRRVRRQSIENGIDAVIVDFKTFNEMAVKGAPQALETMFSGKAVSEYFEAYRLGYRTSSPEVIRSYLRTMKAFSLNFDNKEKPLRHALRLAMNLEELLYTGRFNPTLTSGQVKTVKRLAAKPFPEFVKELATVTPVEVEWGDALNERLKN